MSFSFPVTHRALGVPSPTFATLRAVSEPEAAALWDVAAGLAAWRVETNERVRDLLGESHRVPYSRGIPRFEGSEPAIDADDLARAIVASRPDLLEPLIGGPPLDAASTFWRARVRPGGGSLAFGWGRRWAARWTGTPIGIDDLTTSLPPRTVWALALLSPNFVDGLVTEREAHDQLLDRSQGTSCRFGGSTGPAFLDRRGLVGRVSACVLAGPGAVLLGAAGSGRRTVLRELRDGFPPKYGYNIDNYHGMSEAHAPTVEPRMICAWTRPDHLGPELVRRAVALSLDPASDFKLILSVTPEQWTAVQITAPDVARLPVVPFPDLTDDELLPIWLCQRPHIEERFGRRLDLCELLDRLDGATFRSVLTALDVTGRRTPEDGYPSDLGNPAGQPPRAVRGRALAQPERVLGTLHSRMPWLQTMIPTPEHLVALVRLDDALSG